MPHPGYIRTRAVLDASKSICKAAVNVLRLMARGPQLLKPGDALEIAEDLAAILTAIVDLQEACEILDIPSDSTSP